MSRPLILLLCAVLIKEIAWSSFIPLWQTPDEQAHYAQVNLVTQTGNMQQLGNNSSEEILISEKILGTFRDSAGNNKYTYHPEFNIPYSPSTVGLEEKKITSLPKDSRRNMVTDEGTGYPFLYYSLVGLLDRTLDSGNLFDRVFAIRILSSLTLVGIVLAAYKTGKLIFQNEQKSLILGILVGFQPMLSFVHSGVTSDALFNLEFSIFFYLCVWLIVKGLSAKSLIMLCLLIWVSFQTKQQSYIMLFILAPLLTVLTYLRLSKVKKIARYLPIYFSVSLITLVLIFVLAINYIGLSKILPNSEVTYIDPSVTIFEHIQFTLSHTIAEVLPWYWGVFRWLSLGLPDILRKLTNWLTILSFLGFGIFIALNLIKKNIDKLFWLKVFSFFAIFVYFCAISAFDFSFRRSHGFSFGIQGRYFFPVVIAQMVIFLVGLELFVPKKLQHVFERTLGIGMILLSLAVFFWVIGSYYTLSIPAFFIQASQYKPVWLKSPFNMLILLFSSIISAVLAFSILQSKKSEQKNY